MAYLSELILAEASCQSLWKFNETSGATVTDYGPAGADAVLTGVYTRAQAAITPEGIGTSTLLDGTSGYATAGNVHNFEYDDPFTLLVVAHITETVTAGQALVSKRDGITDQNRGYFFHHDGGTAALRLTLVNDNAGTVYQAAARTNTYNYTNSPRLYVVTYDGSGSASGVTLYIDGLACASPTIQSDTLGTNTMSTAGSFLIGAQYYAGAAIDFPKGYIQHVAVFNAELSAETIWTFGEQWHSRYAKALLDAPSVQAVWPLYETTGTIASELFSSYPGTYTDTYALGADGLVKGEDSTALSVAGAGYVTCGDVLDKEYNQPFSVSCVVQLTTALPATHMAVVTKRGSETGLPGYTVYAMSGGQINFNKVNSNVTPYYDTVETTAAFDWTKPHHIVVVDANTGSHTASNMVIYVDGVVRATTTKSDTLTTQSTVTAGPLCFGGYYTSSLINPLTGTLQYVAFFDAALSAEDVADLYAVYRAQVATMGESVYLTELFSTKLKMFLADGASLTEDLTDSYAANILRDVVRFSETPTLSRNRQALLAEVVTYIDSWIRKTPAALADGVDLATSEFLQLATRLADRVRGADLATVRLAASLVEAAAFVDQLLRRLPTALSDAAKVGETSGLGLRLILGEVVALSEIQATLRSLLADPTERVAVSDTPAPLAQLHAWLQDVPLLGGVLILHDTEYVAWVANTHTLGVSRYSGYNFNSISGELAAREDGIYRLVGDDDAGTPIEAAIRTGMLDFGAQEKKSNPYAYLTATVDGRMLLKVRTSSRGEQVEDWYEMTISQSTEDNSRFQVGRGLKARYWQYELSNVDGARFEVTDLRIPVILTSRRI